MKLTPKLNLKKPDLTDNVNIQDLNDNMDVLEEVVSELQEGATSIPDLETNDKTLAGAINELKNEITNAETSAKEYTDQHAAAIDTALTNHRKDVTSHVFYAVESGGDANGKTAKINADITAYQSGLCVTFYSTGGANANGHVSLNVNNLGLKHIVKPDGSAHWMPGEFPINQYVTVRQLPNNGSFQLQSKGGVVPNGSQKYTTAGTYEFTVPSGVTRIMYKIWGAGGGGGGSSQKYPNVGGGGGGGGAFIAGFVNVTPGYKHTVIVGKGGARGLPQTNPNAAPEVMIAGGVGGFSAFGNGRIAYGGGGGSCAYSSYTFGKGGKGAKDSPGASGVTQGDTAGQPQIGLPVSLVGDADTTISAYIGGTDGSYGDYGAGAPGAGGNSDAYGGYVGRNGNSNPQQICNTYTGSEGGRGGSVNNGGNGGDGTYGSGGGGGASYYTYDGNTYGGNGGDGRVYLYW